MGATKVLLVGGDSDTGNRSPWSWEAWTPKNQKSMSESRLRGSPWAPPPHSYPRGGVYCWIAPTLRDHAISHRVARSVSKRILDFRNNLSPWLREFTRWVWYSWHVKVAAVSGRSWKSFLGNKANCMGTKDWAYWARPSAKCSAEGRWVRAYEFLNNANFIFGYGILVHGVLTQQRMFFEPVLAKPLWWGETRGLSNTSKTSAGG